MNRIRLKMALTDIDYLNRLSQYIKINGLNVFEIVSQNEQVTLCDSEKPDVDDMFLVCPDKRIAICKYQSPDRIMNEIVENTCDCNTNIQFKSVSRNKVVIVTSVHGGAGKSFISQGLAICAARMGKNILYISLDGYSVNDGVFSSENEKDISIVLHYTKKQQGDLNTYIEKYKNHDIVHNVYYLQSIYPSCDTALDFASSVFFVDSLSSNELYDYTFIDCPLFANSVYLNMMKKAEKTVLVKSTGSNREEQVSEFLKSNSINTILACNMVRYTEGIYIPKAEEDLSQNPKSFFESMEQLMYELECDDGK